MDFISYKHSLEAEVPPAGLTPALRALWFDARGDWQAAHEAVQSEKDTDSAWVHAYLHRKEGDDANASYWYSRAGQAFFAESLTREWDEIVQELLARE